MRQVTPCKWRRPTLIRLVRETGIDHSKSIIKYHVNYIGWLEKTSAIVRYKSYQDNIINMNSQVPKLCQLT